MRERDGELTYLRTDLQGKQMMQKESKNDEFEKCSRHRERQIEGQRKRERVSDKERQRDRR